MKNIGCILILIFVVRCQDHKNQDENDDQKFHAACTTVMGEIEYQISTVVETINIEKNKDDIEKKISIDVCEKMYLYGILRNTTTGEVKYVQSRLRDGYIKLKPDLIDSLIEKDDGYLKEVCHDLFELNDDAVYYYFQNNSSDSKEVFCADISEGKYDDYEDEGTHDELWLTMHKIVTMLH